MTFENHHIRRQQDLSQDSLQAASPVQSSVNSTPSPANKQTADPIANRQGYELKNKENVVQVNIDEVLQRLMTLPITTWNYKHDNPTVRHIGPMTEDVAAAFGLENSEHPIYAVDISGVALAAIQALYQRLQQKDADIAALQADVNRLNQEFLERKLRISDALAVLMA